MIVVVNPSGSAGHSFKGLHAYCAHDQGSARTSERVDWIDSRNIANDDPNQAWKVMVATAGAQNELKRAAGVKAGRRSKEGAVMHVVLSFDKDEPTDRDTMESAADEFLDQLGVDPAKMRGKSKPKRRQFASEHQVMMYAHTDTEHAHLHLMINTVHPEHGVKLPSNNNFIKAQKWALEFSKRMGTDHKTPARSENAEMREAGEYVKGERRKSRNIYELEKALAEAGLDRADFKKAIAQERKKDATLALRGRNLRQLQDRAASKLVEGHHARKATIERQHRTRLNESKATIREEFRPIWRKMRIDQASERTTFVELESSFFGRASNMAKTVRLSASDIGGDRTGIVTRTFRILTNAGERKSYFEAAQNRARMAVQRQQAEKVSDATKSSKAVQAVKMAANRRVLDQQRTELVQTQKAQNAKLQDDWKLRIKQRAAAISLISTAVKQSKPELSPREKAIFEEFREDFGNARRSPALEQNSRKDRDEDRER